MLPVREPLKVFLLHFASESPLLRESAVPFSAYPVTFGVVILLRVRELLFVIGLRLAGTERFGDGQHDSLEVGFLSGGDAFGVLRLSRTDPLRRHSARLKRALPDFDHMPCDLTWNETGFGFYGSQIWKAERHYQI